MMKHISDQSLMSLPIAQYIGAQSISMMTYNPPCTAFRRPSTPSRASVSSVSLHLLYACRAEKTTWLLLSLLMTPTPAWHVYPTTETSM
jgi:hypothetical protein